MEIAWQGAFNDLRMHRVFMLRSMLSMAICGYNERLKKEII